MMVVAVVVVILSVQPCSSIGDSVGQLSPHLLILYYLAWIYNDLSCYEGQEWAL